MTGTAKKSTMHFKGKNTPALILPPSFGEEIWKRAGVWFFLCLSDGFVYL